MVSEKQTIPVEVFYHESPETITIPVTQRGGKDDAARGELRGQCVRIDHINVGIPTERRLTTIVGDGFDHDLFAVADITERLKHDGRPIAADNAEKLVLRSWTSKGYFKTQLIVIERERRRDVSDDKERCDTRDCACHRGVSRGDEMWVLDEPHHIAKRIVHRGYANPLPHILHWRTNCRAGLLKMCHGCLRVLHTPIRH